MSDNFDTQAAIVYGTHMHSTKSGEYELDHESKSGNLFPMQIRLSEEGGQSKYTKNVLLPVIQASSDYKTFMKSNTDDAVFPIAAIVNLLGNRFGAVLLPSECRVAAERIHSGFRSDMALSPDND